MTHCTCPSGDGSLRWPCPEHTPPMPFPRSGFLNSNATEDAALKMRARLAFGVARTTPPAFAAVDERHGRPARVEAAPSLRHYFVGGAIGRPGSPLLDTKPRVKGRVLRDQRYTLHDEAALLLPMDDLKRTLAAAADDLARRLFADTPLALATIVRTGIVPWDIEYQTTTDGATFDRVTRLVEYERGARRG